MVNNNSNKLKAAIASVSKDNDADVLLVNTPMGLVVSCDFIDLIKKRNRKKNVFIILVTSGGDAHSAYRMGRTLQNKYESITVFISGWCKSAGTLLAISANELVIGDHGEMGPIDVQRIKPDEVWQRSSGLTEESSIKSLETAVWKMFESYLNEIKEMSGGQIGFKAASEAISPLIVGAFAPIFSQIDPLKIGENARAMKIANDYGARLNIVAQNLKKPQNMRLLVSSYPDHGFVIDRREAALIFANVREPNKNEEKIFTELGDMAMFPPYNAPGKIEFLNPEAPISGSRKKPTKPRKKPNANKK